MKRIDCAAIDPRGMGLDDHRCGLEPGHDTEFHLCIACPHSWPNEGVRLTEDAS